MTTGAITAGSRGVRLRPAAAAFTLLEVLVSMGIIIGALAGIAALLPAAGARLGEATEIDRAGIMAANARADMANRAVLSLARDLWPATTNAIVFGEGLTLNSTKTVSHSTNEAVDVGPRIGSGNFLLQDTLVGGGAQGVCYGCMLSWLTDSAPSSSSAPVRLTTVVFRKPSAAVLGLALTATANVPVFQVTGTLTASGAVVPVATQLAATLRSQYLAGCSWVVMVSDTAAGQVKTPRWAQIASSWTGHLPGVTSGPPNGTSSVVLTGTAWQSLKSGNTLRVYGFDGLLRLDERTVTRE